VVALPGVGWPLASEPKPVTSLSFNQKKPEITYVGLGPGVCCPVSHRSFWYDAPPDPCASTIPCAVSTQARGRNAPRARPASQPRQMIGGQQKSRGPRPFSAEQSITQAAPDHCCTGRYPSRLIRKSRPDTHWMGHSKCVRGVCSPQEKFSSTRPRPAIVVSGIFLDPETAQPLPEPRPAARSAGKFGR